MRSGIVAVWDKDREYAVRLSEYLSRQSGMASSVVYYSDSEALRQAVDTHQVSVAVVGHPVAESAWLKDIPVLTLAEERSCEGTAVYKYQPACEVFRIISGFRERAEAAPALSGPAAKLRAVYSPLGGCLKTSLGLVMSCVLAEEKNCLFLSLEAHSGFRALLDRQYPVDLSDLFAAVRQRGDLQGELTGAVQSLGKLRYIPPVIWPEDIREAEQGELRELLRQLACTAGYDEVILDVGLDLARPEEILSWCERIYRPEKEDAFSSAKLAEYDSYLKASGQEALLDRTRKIPLSALSQGISPLRLSQWQRWEQMVPVVRRILAQEEQDG